MSPELFSEIAEQELEAVPERFARHVKNLALLIEDEPNDEVRAAEGLMPEETLLGLYQGIPLTERGAEYGVLGTLPDTITLYRLPLLDEGTMLLQEGKAGDFENAVRLAVRETLWHEIGHFFGLSEEEVHAREDEGSNRYT